MKVCHITTVHPYNDVRIFLKQCASLYAMGYEVHLIAPEVPKTMENNINLHGINKKYTSRILRMVLSTIAAYRKAIKIGADIYHFHDPELLFVGLMLRVRGKKVIYDVHENVPGDIMMKNYIPEVLRKPIASVINVLEKVLARCMTGVICATPQISNRFGHCKNVEIINNYPILGELARAQSEKKKHFAYVGGICEERGIYEMVRSLRFNNYPLALAGTFKSANEKLEASKIESWNRVLELGQLNRNEVAQLLSEAYAGLVLFHPQENHIEALPNKMFEYMSAGVPVIASNFPLWKEIIEGNQCGICVDPTNDLEIAEAMKYIAENSEQAKKMGENGRKAVFERYNWDVEKRKLQQFYQSLSLRKNA